MTAETAHAPPPPDDSADKTLALVSYVILFAAPFVAGFPSVISVIIAYVRRGSAPQVMRTHYDFQVRIFWYGVLLIAAGFVFAAVAVMTGFGLMWSAWGDLPATMFGFGTGTALLVVACLMSFLANMVWMICASIFGFARLIEGRPIGRVAPSSTQLPTAA